MEKKKSKVKKTTKKRGRPRKKVKDIETQDVSVDKKSSKKSSKFSLPVSWKNIALVVIIIVAILVWKFKGYFVVATINGQPISRFELTNQLIRRFGPQALENIVNERLIVSAIRQEGIFVTPEEIEDQVNQVEERLQGQMSLEEALKMQGLSSEEFKRQIEIQLGIDKLFDEEASVSAAEIDEYRSENWQSFKNATDPAKVRQEIKDLLKRQKIGELFDKWFSEIKEKANIKMFL